MIIFKISKDGGFIEDPHHLTPQKFDTACFIMTVSIISRQKYSGIFEKPQFLIIIILMSEVYTWLIC